MKKSILFSLLVFSIVQPARAEEGAPFTGKGQVEIGAAVGYPIGVGLVIGYWGPQDFPILARFSTGVGSTVEVGIAFSNEDDLKAYASLSAGVIGYLGVFADNYTYIGPTVGVRFNKLFSFGLGPSVRLVRGKDAALMVNGYMGISGLF